MDEDSGYWENQGAEDIQSATRALDYNPLLDTFIELAICCAAVEANNGIVCTSCTCELLYHVFCADGACEFCGCEEPHRLCFTCGESRPNWRFPVSSNTCQFCLNYSPIKIKPSTGTKYVRVVSDGCMIRTESTRAKEARAVLLELTE